jgi:hypothetical protein
MSWRRLVRELERWRLRLGDAHERDQESERALHGAVVLST